MIEIEHRSLQVTCVGRAGVFAFVIVAIQVCFISISFDMFLSLSNFLLKLINYSYCYQPTRTAHSGQVDEFRNPMKNELKTTRV